MFDFKSLIDAITRRARGEDTLNSPTQMMLQLPRHESLAALIEIVREVAELNRNPNVRLKERYRSVLYFDEKLQPLTELLVAVYRGKEVVDDISPRQVLPSLLACWQEMGSAYKVCLKQYADAPSRQFAPQAEIATLRAMEYYARQGSWAYLRYFDPEPRVWRNLNNLFQIAEAAGFLDKPIRWRTGEKEPVSVSNLYMAAMLLYVTEPHRRLPNQIWQVKDWVSRCWVKDVKLEATLRPRDQLFAINLNEPHPPMRLRRNMVGTRYRYFDTTTLSARVAQDAEQARTGNFPSELGAIHVTQLGATAQLLQDLAVVWSREGQTRRRRFERNALTRSAEVAHGLQGVAKLFNGVTTANIEASIEGRHSLELIEWTLEDESNNGLGANYRARYHDPLCVGELVAIREETSRRPTIGVVRRLHKTREGKVRVGVEKLGSQPALICLNDGTRSHYALFSPDSPQAGGQRGILMSNFLYAENREYTMVASGKSYRIRLGTSWESLPTYTLSSFLVLEKL